ncbi:endonuclease domain-containing protein [Blastococcus sp. SYSU D00922]
MRVLHGVYADPSLPRDHALRCRATALLMPERAALGGRSAAALLGGPQPAYSDPVTVVVPPDVTWTGPRGVRVHRAELAPEDVRTSDHQLLHTTPLRTAWDVAALEPIATAVGVLDALVGAGRVDVEALRRLLHDRGGRWGSRRVRRAFELVDGRSGSPPESWVRVACALAGLPSPVPQYEVVEGGNWLARVDLAWPDARLIVEYEGAYHFDGVQIVRDDARLARLVAAGWRVIRLAAHDLRDMDAVVRRIAEALATPPIAG